MNISAQQTESYAFLRWYLEILIVACATGASLQVCFFFFPSLLVTAQFWLREDRGYDPLMRG